MPALPSMITSLLGSLFLSDYRSEFPCRTIRIINDHVDEVWFCRFSPDGKRLATGSKDGKLMIWDIDQVNITLYFVFMHYLHMRLVSEFTYTAMYSNVMHHTVLLIRVNIRDTYRKMLSKVERAFRQLSLPSHPRPACRNISNFS